MRSLGPQSRLALLVIVACGLLVVAHPPAVRGDCPFCIQAGPAPPGSGPNVRWSAHDSLATCPGGDSIVVSDPFHDHPARLRVSVEYFDDACGPRPGVPPDSIWVTYVVGSGNLVVNDQSTKVFADDPTDDCGFARITIPSFSGCGTVTISLYVSGVFQGSKTIKVRTADTNGNGRVDEALPCDLNYDGLNNDGSASGPHLAHWRRNALHGSLVQRTNYCETCPAGAVGTKGGGPYWSPSGRFLSHTAFVDAGPGNDPSCKVFIVPSDPADGDALVQFTSAPIWYHDYDPDWSPLNTEIVFDRGDSMIIRKPVPWIGTAETVVTASNYPGCQNSGDINPAFSPDGRWVAISRCNGVPPGGWHLWKIPIGGGTGIQLTPIVAARTDYYPSWSPDGQIVYFQRNTSEGGQWSLWKVPAAGGTATQVFAPPSSPDIFDAVQPASSPDGAVLTLGYGKRDFVVRNVITHTLDPGLPSPTPAKVVPNYADPAFAEMGNFPILFPKLSPDGTRLALGSKQVWAVRRNMNLPPHFATVTSSGEGTRAVADTAAMMGFTFSCPPGTVNTITVSATDQENDALTYLADFLITGMSWNPTTRTLTYLTGEICPQGTFYVRFRVTTPSGGTDALIAAITFPFNPLGLHGAGPSALGEERAGTPTLPSGAFVVMAPHVPGATARLTIFDLAGRRVATVRGKGGEQLIWERRDDAGVPVSTGVYLYRLEAGDYRRDGKVVVR